MRLRLGPFQTSLNCSGQAGSLTSGLFGVLCSDGSISFGLFCFFFHTSGNLVVKDWVVAVIKKVV